MILASKFVDVSIMSDFSDYEIPNEWYKRILRICRKRLRYSNNREEDINDLFQDLILRVPRILELTPKEHTNKWPHLSRCLNWYAYKWVNKQSRQCDRFTHLSNLEKIPEIPIFEVTNEKQRVIKILKQLNTFDRYVLIWRFVDGLTLEEIGNKYNVTKTTALRWVNEALCKARMRAKEE